MSPSKENPVGDETFDYNDRYGITPKRAWILPAALFAIIGLAWTLWAALDHSQPELRSTLYSFSITGEREITMRYAIERRDPQAVVICTLLTLDIDKNVFSNIKPFTRSGYCAAIATDTAPPKLLPKQINGLFISFGCDDAYCTTFSASIIIPFSDGIPVLLPYPL